MRPRVQRAPGLPCALSLLGRMNLQNSGAVCRGKAKLCLRIGCCLKNEFEQPTHVVPASAPGPIRRGLAFWAVWPIPSVPINARGYGFRRGGRDNVVIWRSAVPINVIARSACDEAIQLFLAVLDCFANARNDDVESARQTPNRHRPARPDDPVFRGVSDGTTGRGVLDPRSLCAIAHKAGDDGFRWSNALFIPPPQVAASCRRENRVSQP
jgi:hypothetical protein